LIVLDTHTWIWSVVAPRRLSRKAKQAIDRADRIGIATMTVFELADLSKRGRLELDTPVRTWVRDALAHERVEQIPLTAEVALDAAQLSLVGDPFDRIIYATARAADAQLVTRDERMHAFDPDRAVW
jgi:PIN domain nuclease of toxin-antitoxin system